MADFNVGAIVARLVLDSKQYNDAVDEVEKKNTTFAKEITKNSQRVKKFGRALTVAGGAIVGVFTAMTLKSMAFNKEMARVATLIPNSAGRVDELKESLRDMAIEVGKSTTDLAGGLFEVVSAFGDTSETAKILNINARAAAAGMSTTLEAIKLTSAATKGYGDTSAAAIQKTADLAFMTNKLGQTTFPELAASIGKVIPLAAKMNVKQEELFAGFATLTGVTGNAAEVSTQFSGILRAMIKPSEEMAFAIDEAGFSTAEAMLKQLGMVGTLEKLASQTRGTTQEMGLLFPRAEALAAVFALTGSQAETFAEKFEKMKDPMGAAEEAFKEVSEGVNKVGFEFEQAKVRMTIAMQRIGETLLPIASQIIKKVSSVVTTISTWVKENPKLAATITKIAFGAGALMAVLGPMLMMLPQLVTGVTLATKAFLLVPGPIMIVVAAVAALKIGFNALEKAQKKAMAAIVDANTKEVAAIQTLMEFRKKATEKEKQFINDSMKRLEADGRTRTEANILIANELNNRSKSFREFSKERNKVEKELTDAEKAEIAARTLARKMAADKAKIMSEQVAAAAVESSKKEIDARKKALADHNKILDEQMEGFEALTLFQIEQDSALATFKEQQELQRQIDSEVGLQQDLLRLKKKHDAEKAALATEFLDKTLLKAALLELEIIHDAEVQALRDAAAEAEKEKKKQFWLSMVDLAAGAANAIMSVTANAARLRSEEIDREYEARRQWIMDNVTDETEREKQLEALEAELGQKKKEAASKAARADKAAALVSAVVGTAAGIAKALPNIPLAILAGIMGAAQIAIIKSQPIPLAEGGITTGPTSAIIGDNPSGKEAVIPLERMEEVFGSHGNTYNFHINAIDGASVQRIIPQIIPLLENAAKTENFLIPPNAVR